MPGWLARNKSTSSSYDLLFRTAAETLLTIAADPRHLGARISATAVLHSWGSAVTHHPHVHMIVPGGGLSLDGTRRVRCKPGFLLPVLSRPGNDRRPELLKQLRDRNWPE
jgi:hypothetical protein